MTPATKAPRILVVDDEAQIARVLRASLTSRGYELRTASDGISALEVMQDWTPDLVITDLSMPQMDGLELTRRIRATSAVPIIVLSVRNQERVKVQALDAGADDYITKPFGIDELVARVRASLRRTPSTDDKTTAIAIGDFHIDLAARRLSVRGHDIHLTPKEFDLLTHMARHAGKVLTHRALLAAIWGGDSTEQVEYLRVFVAQLRKKLKPDADAPQYILTEPWIGYRFEPGK